MERSFWTSPFGVPPLALGVEDGQAVREPGSHRIFEELGPRRVVHHLAGLTIAPHEAVRTSRIAQTPRRRRAYRSQHTQPSSRRQARGKPASPAASNWPRGDESALLGYVDRQTGDAAVVEVAEYSLSAHPPRCPSDQVSDRQLVHSRLPQWSIRRERLMNWNHLCSRSVLLIEA